MESEQRGWVGGGHIKGGVWLADKGSYKEMQGWRFSIHPGRRPWKGWGQEGQRVMESLRRSSKHTRMHMHTLSRKLTRALHKSLSLNVSVAASGKPSTWPLHGARCSFSFCTTQLLSDTSVTPHLFTSTPRKGVKFAQMYNLRHFYKHPPSSPMSFFTAPWVALFY